MVCRYVFRDEAGEVCRQVVVVWCGEYGRREKREQKEKKSKWHIGEGRQQGEGAEYGSKNGTRHMKLFSEIMAAGHERQKQRRQNDEAAAYHEELQGQTYMLQGMQVSRHRQC